MDILKVKTKLPIVPLKGSQSLFDFYKVLDILGKGQYGVVFSAHPIGDPEHIVAVKSIQLKSNNSIPNIMTEIEALYLAQKEGCGQYIGELYDVLYDEKEKELHFVMELLKGDNLKDWLKKNPITNEEDALRILEPLQNGLNCLHDAEIAHRDIKNDNVMVSNGGDAKWIDFGLSCVDACRHMYVGNLGHMAPEVFSDPKIRTVQEWITADLWGFGCLAFELIAGDILPFQETVAIEKVNGKAREDIEDFILTEKPLEYDISPEKRQKLEDNFPKVMELIRVCLTVNPALREYDYKVRYVFEKPSLSESEEESSFSDPRPRSKRSFQFIQQPFKESFSDPRDFKMPKFQGLENSEYSWTSSEQQRGGGWDEVELLAMSQDGNLIKVKKLVEEGADVNTADEETGDTPLILATSRNHLDIVKFLVENGADINATDKNGATALTIASHMSHEIARYLIKGGADVNATDAHGWTALLLASGSGEIKSAELLLENGANTEIANKKGTALMHAVLFCGDVEMVELLLKYNANVNAKDSKGKTALMIASKQGNAELVRLLLENGANVKAADDNGLTAAMYAERKGHFNLSEFFYLLDEMKVNLLDQIEVLHEKGFPRDVAKTIAHEVVYAELCGEDVIGRGSLPTELEVLANLVRLRVRDSDNWKEICDGVKRKMDEGIRRDFRKEEEEERKGREDARRLAAVRKQHHGLITPREVIVAMKQPRREQPSESSPKRVGEWNLPHF